MPRATNIFVFKFKKYKDWERIHPSDVGSNRNFKY